MLLIFTYIEYSLHCNLLYVCNNIILLSDINIYCCCFCCCLFKKLHFFILSGRYFYPSFIRAHHGAAIAGTDKAVKGARTATEADYIQKREFRLFCASLCFYGIALDAFHIIDGFAMEMNRVDGHYKTTEGEDNDRRLSLAEWRKNYRALSGSCCVLALASSK